MVGPISDLSVGDFCRRRRFGMEGGKKEEKSRHRNMEVWEGLYRDATSLASRVPTSRRRKRR